MEKVEIYAELGTVFGPWRNVNLEIRIGGHKARAGTVMVHEQGYSGGPRQAAVDLVGRAISEALDTVQGI